MLKPAAYGFGNLFDLVSEAVIVADSTNGVIELWNDAATRMFGYTIDEAVGMPVAALVPDELRESHRAGIQRFAARGTIVLTEPGQTVEVPAVRRDGSRLWVELSLTALTGAHDRKALALIRDVSDRRRAQDDLERVNQALRDFVAVAAHDLRSPTAAISMAVELLDDALEAEEVSPEARELAALVARQARQQLSLIEDLLDLASLDAGTVRVAPDTVSLADEVGRAAGDHDDVTVVGPAQLTCFADPRHVTRILTNLVTNAYRHGKPPVTVEIRADEPMVRVTVCDAGDGVPTDMRAQLFNAYVSGAASVGTGLGLSIARRLAEANGGDLQYERGEHGSCFVLRLPANAPVAAPVSTGTGLRSVT